MSRVFELWHVTSNMYLRLEEGSLPSFSVNITKEIRAKKWKVSHFYFLRHLRVEILSFLVFLFFFPPDHAHKESEASSRVRLRLKFV